jgi:hypothetical protein
MPRMMTVTLLNEGGKYVAIDLKHITQGGACRMDKHATIAQIRAAAQRACGRRLIEIEWSNSKPASELAVRSENSAIVPDALFGLRFDGEEASYFMLEIDRGEMPVERYKNAQRTYFAKKMLTYYEANRQQRHVHDLGIVNFRVLTVTTTKERVERMLAALGGITEGRGSNMFLFADQGTLTARNALDLEWVSGKRELIRLVD